jgi:uncharacterized protein YkwD
MRHAVTATGVVMLAIFSAACAQVGSPVAPSSGGATDAPAGAAADTGVARELSFCVDETNRLRASVGLGPLRRSTALEEFATAAAAHDSAAREAHHYFRRMNGAGVSRAETEILWWRNQAVREVIKGGLAQMWKVGPGGDHYDIMTGAYTETGCGVFVDGSEVTVAQDFR